MVNGAVYFINRRINTNPKSFEKTNLQKLKETLLYLGFLVVEHSGFEPLTSSLPAKRSPS